MSMWAIFIKIPKISQSTPLRKWRARKGTKCILHQWLKPFLAACPSGLLSRKKLLNPESGKATDGLGNDALETPDAFYLSTKTRNCVGPTSVALKFLVGLAIMLEEESIFHYLRGLLDKNKQLLVISLVFVICECFFVATRSATPLSMTYGFQSITYGHH